MTTLYAVAILVALFAIALMIWSIPGALRGSIQDTFDDALVRSSLDGVSKRIEDLHKLVNVLWDRIEDLDAPADEPPEDRVTCSPVALFTFTDSDGCMHTFDATRIIAVTEARVGDQQLASIVTDRSTLVCKADARTVAGAWAGSLIRAYTDQDQQPEEAAS